MCMKTLCDSRVLWKLYQYILFTSIKNTCSIVLLIVPTHGVRFLVHVGVGRFKNKSYTDFLKAWNTARGLKTKIGPLEVCTAPASYQCLPKRLGTRLACTAPASYQCLPKRLGTRLAQLRPHTSASLRDWVRG